MPRLSLGFDSSTQSLKAVAIDIDSGEKVWEHSLNYRKDPRLNKFGINEQFILPPRHPGEADQPPQMYFASIDAMFEDMPKEIRRDILVINNSGQQHGHVYLNQMAKYHFERLRNKGSSQRNLVDLLKSSLAYDRAPIWMTSDTLQEANEIREAVGGKQKMIEISGSDSPLRFTGAKIRKIRKEDYKVYDRTERIQLIGNLIQAILTGNSDVPCDFANACGMSLMDYKRKEWSVDLLEAVVKGFGGGEDNHHKIYQRLPKLAAPDSFVGKIAEYFVEKYGVNPECAIVAGSGDNPESKVLVSGDLLSLGTSFVNMVSTDGRTFDMAGFANAMYDGIGRPFMFGCRTNGAVVWDMVRDSYGISGFEARDEALRQPEVGGNKMFFWQPQNESFPVSGIFPQTRIGYETASFKDDITGIIESSLAAVYTHSSGFTTQTSEPLYVTGGPAESDEVMKRVAAMWNRPVIPIESGGVALGAAVAGAYAYRGKSRLESYNSTLLHRKSAINPNPEHVKSYHGEGGYLERFREQEARLIAENPIK